jgi:PKD repeat protein
MKRILIPILFLLLTVPVMSQGWVIINGTVTDELDSLPVVNHPVTILADSANGVVYYNVVFTDSAGYYYDNVPVMTGLPGKILIQTVDCDNNILQAEITYDSVNTAFTQDFRICTLNAGCQAFFEFYPDPFGSPDSYQFTDLSTGNIFSWNWDFGDGTFSQEQNPIHLFPGPGAYEICLVVIGNNCSDTYCNTIVISDTVYQQIFGQVFSGNFPMQTGTVLLYSINPAYGTYTYRDTSPVDSNGIYYFSLVPEGSYIIQAVPGVSGAYLPTYYGDVAGWQQALPVSPAVPQELFNISLIPAGPMAPGPGSVSGQINTGRGDPASIDLINMILMDETGVMIGFSSVSEFGVFDFQSMDYGIYYLRAELSGVASDNMRFEISPERPHVDIVLSYSGNSVLGLGEDIAQLQSLSVYPNPFKDKLTMSFALPAPGKVEISIYSVTGLQVFYSAEYGQKGDNTVTISLKDLPAGIYSMKVSSATGVISSLICSQE